MVMIDRKLKVELERIYKEYCFEDLNPLEGEELIDTLKGFVEFRLSVSGGSGSSMGDIGCETVEGFMNEVFLFQDMMDDWGGMYRGDLSYECLESLKKILEGSDLEESMKIEIIESWKKRYEMDEE
jgi:hypothetical protein